MIRNKDIVEIYERLSLVEYKIAWLTVKLEKHEDVEEMVNKLAESISKEFVLIHPMPKHYKVRDKSKHKEL